MTYGIIPDEISIVSSVEQPVYRRWDDAEEGDRPEEKMVIPAFVCESNNARALATAVSWAERARSYYDNDLKQTVKKSDPVVKEIRKNLPMNGLRVVALEERGNGGRAYKVVSPDNYYFDLREDVMLDTMIKAGLREGGHLNGEFIWARVHSTMKIVRIGSDLYKKLVHHTSRSKTKKVNARNLVPGTVYANKRGEKSAYLGRVNAVDFVYTQDYNHNRYTYGYSSGGAPPKPKFTITKQELKNAHVWISLSTYKKTPLMETYKENRDRRYYIKMSTTHNFIEEVDKLNIDPKQDLKDLAAQFEKETQGKTDEYSICLNTKYKTMIPSDEKFELDMKYQSLPITIKQKTD